MSYYDGKDVPFEALKGEILDGIEGAQEGSEEIRFYTKSGKKFVMFHSQSCCESVQVEEIHGEPLKLMGEEILFAYESRSNVDKPSAYADSWTWTFYRLGTRSETVVLRWLGQSNGYYGEEVTFREITPAPLPQEEEIEKDAQAFGYKKMLLVRKEEVK